MSSVDKAVGYFELGYNCSQAVVGAFCEKFRLERDLVFRLGCGFGGGMGCSAGTCGAVTGAIMVIGLKFGNTEASDHKGKEKAYEMVRQAVDKFMQRNGSLLCMELLGCDISTADGKKYAGEKGLFRTLCPKLVRDAAEIVEEIT